MPMHLQGSVHPLRPLTLPCGIAVANFLGIHMYEASCSQLSSFEVSVTPNQDPMLSHVPEVSWGP